jgi:hypothetical protein
MDFTKDEAYYESLDKRTKEYKEWKEWHEKQSEGLGDTVEKITEATGVKKAVETVLKKFGYDDCGCDARKKKLNKMFRFNKPECLEEEEFVWLSEFFDANKTRVTVPEQEKMYQIYGRVFKVQKELTQCVGCWREVAKKMKALTNAHKQ